MTQDKIKEKAQRLFVAVELPAAIRLLLAERQKGLPGMRWTAPDNLHLTVRFIGEVPQQSGEKVGSNNFLSEKPVTEIRKNCFRALVY